MLLLALDTATPAVTVALHDGRDVVAESTTVDARRHTELLAPAITGVLRAAGADRREITEIAVGVGPGPFTGLRVGLAAAQVLGAALDRPVRGVCSLDVVAHGVIASGGGGRPFVVATDARRREVYWAGYDASGRRLTPPQVATAADAAAAFGQHLSIAGADDMTAPAAGAGPRLYPDAFPVAVEPEYPSAADLAAVVVGGYAEIVEPDPLYLRRPDIAPPAPRKSVLT
ncbi:tRNA (adenosine(37)-N6)-threonylcarbamoyltransferase complex dimerization subunit type 1 TsaB [Phytoactinopolyspora alkaliphila]|uniref:tRNA (Adenosine(37)-N6)-threonylcarbamoyltransferase complex dimerization subunit type 1 TsaB n=1 Tax=Phytoactinopolyspora alkaliphila TaxID=1783498 RepID=A0A6N9YHH9_9ACTN|nr:tRNA (adenosine(37)-N6)-threonylcarbamoyltransferase complex dimerization subunit type 1 TsaB [Phytoactinopolyspora alkaliphila]